MLICQLSHVSNSLGSILYAPECRLAMMGALGMLTQSLVQLPGFEGVPKDVTAATVGNGQVGFLLVIGIIAVLEAAVFVQDDSKEPGNFGNPLPWFDDYSDEMRAREINNGRIAMFAAIGQISAGLYTGKAGLEQFGVWELWRSRRLRFKTLLFLSFNFQAQDVWHQSHLWHKSCLVHWLDPDEEDIFFKNCAGRDSEFGRRRGDSITNFWKIQC